MGRLLDRRQKGDFPRSLFDARKGGRMGGALWRSPAAGWRLVCARFRWIREFNCMTEEAVCRRMAKWLRASDGGFTNDDIQIIILGAASLVNPYCSSNARRGIFSCQTHIHRSLVFSGPSGFCRSELLPPPPQLSSRHTQRFRTHFVIMRRVEKIAPHGANRNGRLYPSWSSKSPIMSTGTQSDNIFLLLLSAPKQKIWI